MGFAWRSAPGGVFLRRIGQCVSINLVDVKTSTGSGSFAAGLPDGFNATYRDVRSGMLAFATGGQVRWVGLAGNGTTSNFVGHTYMTADPWPAYLPGIAA